ncbi:MAG: hypothetical protein Kow00121_40430 [Elainellaceae cyanobacterium]
MVATRSDFATTLKQVVLSYRDSNQRSVRPNTQAVVAALLQAEKAVKKQRLQYSPDALLGTWQLCFTAPRNAHLQGDRVIGRGFYVPQIIPAQISFQAGASQVETSQEMPVAIGNQLRVGGLVLQLTGPARYAAKNLLAFDFTQWQLCLLGRTLLHGTMRGGKAHTPSFGEQPIGKLPFFAFFWITEDCIAARGRGGGIALWLKVP